MNGIIGPIIVIIMAIIIATETKGLTGDVLNVFAVISMTLLTLSLGIAPTTAVSISIEGNKFYSLKSLPISYRTLILSKLTFNFILSFPFMLIAQIIIWIINPFEFGVSLLLFFYYITSLVLYISFGMLMNIKMPKLKWTSETQAVKQGASMITTMIVNMIISFIPMIIYFIFSPDIQAFGITLYMGIIFIFNFILAIIVISLLFTIGKKWFNEIQ